MVLCEANEPIRDVYFPISGVASLVNVMANGFATEVATIGNEGLVGVPFSATRLDQRTYTFKCPALACGSGRTFLKTCWNEARHREH